MRVTKAQADANRAAIIAAASRLFREKGIASVSVAEIVDVAGLTAGAFYSHFRSRREVEAEAAVDMVTNGAKSWQAVVDGAGERPLEALVDYYLTRDHFGASSGCPFATLGPELVRSTPATKQALAAALPLQLAVIEAIVPGTKAERKRRAVDIYTRLVGAVIVARGVEDRALQDEILAATRASILSSSKLPPK
jgi:TetR/AcrR family transcriptional repressor of nem operon